jgi:hypothetical protein
LKFIGDCWKFWFEPKEVTYRLRNLSLIEARSEETLNIQVVGDFINFLKSVEIQDFDTEQRNLEGLKLIGFLRYDFKIKSIFLSFFLDCKFGQLNGFQSFISLCNMSVQCHDNKWSYLSSPQKKGGKYRWRTYRWWQNRTHLRG